jgi:hypothetical protein
MTITREQVADLHEGDVVRLSSPAWADSSIQGPLKKGPDGALGLAFAGLGHSVRYADGSPPTDDRLSLTVVSRAPRPLYVNHPRTEPVIGDVARDADNDSDTMTWSSLGSPSAWYDTAGYSVGRAELPARLRLLVDGETGQVVPS